MVIPFSNLFGKTILSGQFFKEGSNQQHLLFTFEKEEILKEGQTVWKSRFFNAQKKLVALEKLVFEGEKLTEYYLNQSQVKETGKFYLHDNILKMYYSKNEKDSSATLIWNDKTILPPMIPGFLKKQRKNLEEKKSLEVKLVVPHLLTAISYEFRLGKKNNSKCLKKASYCVFFEPGYFFIRWMVEPLILSLDKDFQILKAEGPSLLYVKENSSGKWVPFKGDAFFTY
jgi:hypothetical protein